MSINPEKETTMTIYTAPQEKLFRERMFADTMKMSEKAKSQAHVDAVQDLAIAVLFPVDSEVRAQVVGNAACALAKRYVFEARGKTMAAQLVSNYLQGRYDNLSHPVHFAEALDQDLQTVCPDKHLHVEFSPLCLPQDSPFSSLDYVSYQEILHIQDEESFSESENANFGITEHRVRKGNVGYLKIDSFEPLFPETRTKYIEVLEDLAHTDSLIIDLRNNSGGSPATAAFLASFLFKERTPFLDHENPRSGHSERISIEPQSIPPAARYGSKKPLSVLISPDTFSAAEAFADAIKTKERGILIGQTTRGGAHIGRDHGLTDHFKIFIPTDVSYNPDTGDNWEGRGITPHVELSPREDALSRALVPQIKS